MKTWLDRTEYPFTPQYFEIEGNKLHYIDEGQGETILFVHGTPSWSFDFRHVIKKLSATYRCIAVDHIGFGLSDKPEHYDYSTEHHSRTLEKFVIDKQLTKITLVVHDFGGPIGFAFALRNPERVEKNIVLNSWLWSSESDPGYIKLRKILQSPVLPFMYRYLNFSPRFILPRSFGTHKPSSKILKHYTKPFENKTQRNGALAFARSLLNDQEWFESLWNNRAALVDKPILFIWGMMDAVIKPSYLDKFASGFHHPRIVKLEASGHFPQEEQPDLVTQSIVDFLTNLKK